MAERVFEFEPDFSALYEERERPWSATAAASIRERSAKAETILDEAARLTSGDRDGTYGHPADDYGRTAMIFSAVLGVPVTAEQAILCMMGVKMSRLCHTTDHRDSVVDIAGYARCYERCLERRESRAVQTDA